jgi:hypothetical protein
MHSFATIEQNKQKKSHVQEKKRKSHAIGNPSNITTSIISIIKVL